MCHFVTAVLPAAADQAELDRLARLRGRQFLPLHNPTVEARLRTDERYFLTTLGHCDCGTPLGSHDRKAARAPDWVAEEQKLLRRGWSQAKVARSLEQKRAHWGTGRDNNARVDAEAMASWSGLIETVLDSGATPYLGLLVHFYSGHLDEQIDLVGRVDVPRDGLRAEYLGGMKEDTLYVFQG
ncbi:hypothetical protein J5837_14460 [Pseudoxanthomonas helianthi]|uniref:Uncharacterized protein n=1 Tax=Pseudoxanthomonas helianthi TaxID=1453541 RepID=A0A940X5Y4_9GAMM|nr:hypothetical protein [Pseudoxanthomonas helianthi]MBP3985612.1 hypothetical protein [Pseudoxanthomonas helianthi]